MARITIIPADGFVSIDGVCKSHPLDYSSCGIPADVHALQWYDTRGWIEFNDDNDPFTPKPTNQEVTELPVWANACVAVHAAWTPPPEPEPEVPVEPVTPEV